MRGGGDCHVAPTRVAGGWVDGCVWGEGVAAVCLFGARQKRERETKSSMGGGKTKAERR